MPFFPKIMEFAVISVNEVAVDPKEAGKIRITACENGPGKMEIKRCDESAWSEPKQSDVEWLIAVMRQYEKTA